MDHTFSYSFPLCKSTIYTRKRKHGKFLGKTFQVLREVLNRASKW